MAEEEVKTGKYCFDMLKKISRDTPLPHVSFGGTFCGVFTLDKLQTTNTKKELTAQKNSSFSLLFRFLRPPIVKTANKDGQLYYGAWLAP